jgi:tetratricopeptide (TPR) repeat protein
VRCALEVAVLAACTVLCAAAQAPAPSAADRRSPGFAAYESASRAFQARDFPACSRALDEALRLDPQLIPALCLGARMAMAMKRFDVARETLERAIAADPKSAYARFLYGFQFYQQSEMPAALEALQDARRLNPRDARAPLYMGLARESLGRNAEALADYRDAIRIGDATGKTDPDALLTCARLLLLEGELDECAHLVRRARDLAPASRDPRFEAARLAMKRGDAAGAVREASAALKFTTGDVTERQVRFLLIQAYRALGREEDAAREAAALRAAEERDGSNIRKY